MTAKAPEKQIFEARSGVVRLSGWFRANRPSVDTIRISCEAYKALQKFPVLASLNGFRLVGGEIQFDGYSIKPERE